MIIQTGPRRRVGLALIAGAVGALGLAPYGLWPATVLALAIACGLYARAETGRQALFTGWAFGTGYFGVALLWIVEPFLVEPEIHGWMAPFALVLLAAGLALFWAGAFRLAFAARRLPGLALIAMLGLAELARAYLLTGFPWGGVAQIWVGVGPDLMLAWIGPHGLGVITLLCGLAFSHLLSGGWMRRISGPAAVGFFVAAGIGLQIGLPEPALRDATVRLVQPNAPQDQKWDPERIPDFLDRKLGFSAVQPAPDLIVWPETSIPTLLAYAGPILDRIAAAAPGVPVIAGVQRRDDRRLYNAAVLLRDGAPAEIYDKHHLVPFGEYIPLGDLAARFGLHGFAAREGQGFSAGPGPRLMDLGPLGKALPLICYEAVFPQHATSSGDRADVLIQITNDAWFGDRSGPYQHLAQARMRAIEQGLPMIRVANTGISAMIDPYGRLISSIPLGEAGYVDAALPRPLSPSLYARTGDLPVLAILILVSLSLFGRGSAGRTGK
ncbi:apolipoprotein N-acyltransferase [Aestuariivita sp.]|jgi:apolipoprotein N-acyltransferase|uniref:apolipoprotein N-acyltransferase n=1 Tax=Aestuariivita sp. TaxID=1872407 RepID=UPI00216FA047|nr:apolipoprotein N-acyltransferase [Aestuariivita sp.]MCE8007547.1 apolipoprotein N-acyltransferase [Aestuariivita sp.]